jgi:hypothetical protein
METVTTNIAENEKSILYEKAKDMYYRTATTESIIAAREIFKNLGNHKDSQDFVKKCTTLIEFSIGNTVTYGNYEGKPIQWDVVGENGKMRLLLSSKIITHRAYNTERSNIDWSTCSLRKWLNKDFLNEAFSFSERMCIVNAPKENKPNHTWYTPCGPDTRDKVFILSHDEAEEFVPNPAQRVADEWWWLRTQGHNNLSAEGVYTDGSIYDIGLNIADERIGIRPAIWVVLKRN